LESALDSVLTELGDTTTRVVEYWSRADYMNIDTHSDIDEEVLEDDSMIRCPQTAHILYLAVSPLIRGPTCIFPNQRGGWTALQQQQPGLPHTTTVPNSAANPVAVAVDLVTVPAVQGRVVCFPGNAMHAVPKPAHRWLLSLQEEKALRIQEDEEYFNVEDENTDDDDVLKEYAIERSVILFNCWSNDGPPPRGVTQDYLSGALPDGVVVDDEFYLCAQESDQKPTEAQLAPLNELSCSDDVLRCSSRQVWRQATIAVPTLSVPGAAYVDPSDHPVRVSLMGKIARRLHSKKVANLVTSGDRLRRAVDEESTPSYILLLHEDKES
jgi:hypothetical protein